MTPDALAALIVTVAFAFLVAITMVTLYATRGRRARSNTALSEALHGREDGWGIWVAPEDPTPAEDPSEVDEDPDPVAATYELLAELKASGAPMKQIDEALDVVVALTRGRAA